MAAKGKKSFGKIISSAGGGLFVLFMAAIFVSPLVPLTCGKAAGYYPALMKAIANCPAAVDKLGKNPRAAWVGMNTGSCSSSGSNYRASGRMSVKGDKSSGKLTYAVTKVAGKTTIHAANLTVDGKSINVAMCLKNEGVGGSGGPQEAPMLKEPTS